MRVAEREREREREGGGGEGETLISSLPLVHSPYFGLQVKYLMPICEPSFFPVGSSSSTPAHWPAANSVVPPKRIIPP